MTTIRVPEAGSLEKQLVACRHRATTERVRIIIERTTKRGTLEPLWEVTPGGDVSDFPAATMRTPVRELIRHYMADESWTPNMAAVKGYLRLTTLVAEAEEAVKALSEAIEVSKQARKRWLNEQRRQRHKASSPVANSVATLEAPQQA